MATIDRELDQTENQPPCSWWIRRLYQEPTAAEIAAADRVRAEAKARLAALTDTPTDEPDGRNAR